MSSFSNHETKFGWGARQTSLGPEFSTLNPAVNRTYEDGYVHVDSLGNDSNLSWNWGFQDASQIMGDGTIAFNNRTFSSGSGSLLEEDSNRGIHLSWLGDEREQGEQFSFSLMGSLDFTPLQSELRYQGAADMDLLTDRYSHALFDPSLLPSPYHGDFDGPGPLLGDIPTRGVTSIPGGGVIQRSMMLDGNLLALGAGGEISYEINEKLSLLLQTRIMLGWFNGDFEYADHYSFNSATYASENGKKEISDTITGAVLGAGFLWDIDEELSLFATANRSSFKAISGDLDGRIFKLNDTGILFNLGIQKQF